MDLKGNPGWPIYVGQSGEFGKRVRNHLRKSEKLANVSDSVRKRIKDILHDREVPIFEVLDRQPTRLQSLLSETNFARACRRRGYEIANLRRLQNVAGPPISLRDIPTDWLWEFSLQEAVADAIMLKLGCKTCRQSVEIEAQRFARTPEPPKDLRAIRDNPALVAEACVFCGERGSRFVDLDIP